MRNVKNTLVVMISISISIFMIGCATIFNNGSQTLIARSSTGIEGVNVEVTGSAGSYFAKLPANIVENPSTFKPLEIKTIDKCYYPSTTKVHASITPSFWANILLGGIIGIGVDAFSGYMWKYDNMVSIPTEKKADCAQ